jgi:hypothetical protein
MYSTDTLVHYRNDSGSKELQEVQKQRNECKCARCNAQDDILPTDESHTGALEDACSMARFAPRWPAIADA